jgi:putative flavoprotein involved in K+ transport
MEHVTTVVVGAGQCGLAMSRALARRSVEHVVLERGRIADSWRSERWDSLRLLTPNWMSAPAGHAYRGPDPDGFMSCAAFVATLERSALLDGAPVREGTRVISVEALGSGYRVETDRGAIACANVVIATGACAVPRVPAAAGALPASLLQQTPQGYKRPTDVPEDGVLIVGASASGLQIARELAAAGRRVALAVGNHLRLPRRYRGADILWWMDRIGALDAGFVAADATRLRRLPSLPLAGDPADADLDFNVLQDIGVEIVGRLSAIEGGVAWFSGALANACASADLKLRRLLDRIDAHIEAEGLEAGHPYRLPATRVPDAPRLSCSLRKDGIGAVIWATGYEPDHTWLRLPVFDARGHIRHDGGVVRDGLYVMGLRYLRTARSSHISGAEPDAEVLADHLVAGLTRPAAA